ncbi:RE1 [Symbiodinium sp. KB8]|nr:RE1 [Symbiodinium sp. KB8]
MRRLDCGDSKNWTAFRHLLVSKMEAGRVLGQDFELQEAAEGLLAYADARGGEVQEDLGKEFFAKLGSRPYSASVGLSAMQGGAQEEPDLFPGLPGLTGHWGIGNPVDISEVTPCSQCRIPSDKRYSVMVTSPSLCSRDPAWLTHAQGLRALGLRSLHGQMTAAPSLLYPAVGGCVHPPVPLEKSQAARMGWRRRVGKLRAQNTFAADNDVALPFSRGAAEHRRSADDRLEDHEVLDSMWDGGQALFYRPRAWCGSSGMQLKRPGTLANAMGAGASTELSARLGAASSEDVRELLAALPPAEGQKVAEAIQVSSDEPKAAGDEDEIPPSWGWPKEPYDPEALRLYVLEATKPTQQESWDEALAARSIDGKKEDFVEEKAFANLLLNKEGTGEAKKDRGIDPHAYEKGKWYRFLNYKGDCYVYVHNHTRDITATRPENFAELTEEEKALIKKLGTYIKEVPVEIERVYTKEKAEAIPILYGSQTSCEAMKTFFYYNKNSTLLDATKLKRVNAGALEECRRAMVWSMLGTTLCIYCGDILPDFQEKICISKYKDTFPLSLFMYGGMENELVRERLFRDDAPEVTDTEDPDEEQPAGGADGFLDEFLGDGDGPEGEEGEEGDYEAQPVDALHEPRTPGRPGKTGPRSSGSHSSSSRAAPSPLKSSPAVSSEANKAQRRPRGNLPTAPVFDGDKKKDPKCFRKYVLKVDSYVEIAKNIIDENEIGLRLHAALDGDAADYLEDIPAKTFGTKEGWKVLLRVLKEKFDERRMHKVGSAMKGFFRLDVAGKNMTMVEVADAMDKAARRCKEAGLVIPDEVMVYFLFEHTNSSLERQANVLLRTSGEYSWKKVKQAIELLYPTVQVRSGRDQGREGYRDQRAGGRARGAHETRWEYDPEWRLPASGATEEQVANWLLDHDPAEMIAEQDMDELPEDLARNLHSVMATHRENRQKLARAVQARGFYVSGGKGKKGSKGGGGKGTGKGKGKGGGKSSKGGGKARGGMSLDELKAVTVCGDCGQKGHWRGDAACSAKKVNEVARHDAEDEEDDGGADGLDDWYGYGEEGDDEQWMAERYGYVVARAVQAATRTTTSPPASSVTRPASTSTASLEVLKNEAARIARGVNKVRAKAGKQEEVAISAVEEALRSDDFLASAAVTRRIKETHRPTMSRSSAPEAVENAMRFFGIAPVTSDGGLRDFLQDGGDNKGETIDLDKLRRSFPARRAHWMPGSSRSVLSNRRAPAEVETGKDYLTIDTACENTVVGQRLLERLLRRWQDDFGLAPKVDEENEFYCFGPGEPKRSTRRVHLPVGLGGRALVISTSVIDDRDLHEIPFLAGQDFLTFSEAVIDMGKRLVTFPALGGVTVPALLDATGHLVLELDNFPEGGWPAGLSPNASAYAGMIFQGTARTGCRDVSQGQHLTEPEPLAHQEKYTDLSEISERISQQLTHKYEPNLDDLNSDLQPFECMLPVDHWQFCVDSGMHVRYHLRPRTSLFELTEVADGPEARWLRGERVTIIHGVSEPLWDLWGTGARSQHLPVSWTGMTIFLNADGVWPRDLPVARPSSAVPVKDPNGAFFSVSPASLLPLETNKKVLQFDVGSRSHKDPEIPATRRTGDFQMPSQFLAERPQEKDQHASAAPAEQEVPGTLVMAAVRDQGAHAVRPDQPHGGLHQLRAEHALSSPGTDSLRRGPSRGGDRAPAVCGTYEQEAAKQEARESELPGEPLLLRPPGGREPQAREQAREVSRLPVVRNGVQGNGGRLSGANLRGQGADLLGARQAQQTGRQGDGSSGNQGAKADFNRHGVLGKLVRLLFVLGSGLYSAGIQRLPADELADISSTVFGTSGGSSLFDLSGARAPADHGQGAGTGTGDGMGHGVDIQHRGLRKLRTGQRRRMAHRAREALESSRAQKEMVGQRAAQRQRRLHRRHHDLLELYLDEAWLTHRATSRWGLRAVEPVSLIPGHGPDLRLPSVRRWLLERLEVWDPGLVYISYPCLRWASSSRPVAQHEVDDNIVEATLREHEFEFFAFCEAVARSQSRRGGHVVVCTPLPLEKWPQGHIRNDYREVLFPLGKAGGSGKGGRNRGTQQLVRHLVSDPSFADYLYLLDNDCGDEAGFEDALCRAYWDLFVAGSFGATLDYDIETRPLSGPRQVHFVRANEDEDKWKPLLEQAMEILGRKVQHNMFLDPETDLYKKIVELVPWEIHNVQIAYLPKAKRVRPGLERDHRLSVVLHNDDTIVIEQEELPNVQAPRERFVLPARVGIFVLGRAPGEPGAAVPAAQHGVQRLPPEPGETAKDPELEVMQEIGLVRDDYSDEVWFVGPPLTATQKKLAPFVVKAHRNLGHPRAEDLTRALAQNAKVQPEAVTLSRRLRCATCERTKRPLPPRPASFKVLGSFNDRVCLDLLHLRDAKDQPHWFLHVLEPNGSFNVFYPINSRDPAHVLEVFTNIWMSWAGPPARAWLDKDGAFEADFLERLQALGTEVDNPAAEAHWQAGEVESFNRAFKYVAAKLIDEKQLAGPLEMKLLAAEVGQCMNEKVRTSGCSAYQWVFGKNPRVPCDLLSPDGKLEALQGLDHDSELRLRAWIRAQADSKLAEFRVNEALRTAVLRMPRPPRHHYEPGDLVAFWRNAKNRKGKRIPPGWFRATVVGPHKGDASQSNFWVTSGGRCVLVSKEQMRPAFGTELWRVQERDLEDILQLPPDQYYDETGDGPDAAEATAEQPGEVMPMYDPDEVAEYEPSPLEEGSEQSQDEEVAEAEGAPAAPSRDGSDRTQPSPTAAPMASTAAPGTPVAQLFADQSWRQAPESAGDAGWRRQLDDDGAAQEPESKKQRLEEDEAVAAALEAHRRSGPYLPLTFEEKFANPRDAFAESAFFSGAWVTRKDQKALEKEIPRHLIPEEQQHLYEEARQKEWNTWKKFEAVKALDLSASRWVEQHVDRSRILSTRFCYRNKNAAYPWMEVKAKARLVCRGDQDPDLLTLRRDAPTLTRVGLMIILQIAASFADFFLFNSDITGAFLQGSQELSNRKEHLFLRQPAEGLPGLVRGQVLLVVRGIFGLANSPRLFWRHLRDTLLQLGFVQSCLDKALFMYYRAGQLVLILGTHVDDLLGTGRPGVADEVLDKVKQEFDFGAWADSRTDAVLEYGGKQIKKANGKVELSQEKFIKALVIEPIPRWRSMTPNAELLSKELTELRSGGSCLHWLTGQTRPDLAAATSLAMSGKPTVSHLQEVNRLLKDVKASEDWKLTFAPVQLHSARIVAYTDASWANHEDLRSQAGYLVFVAGQNVFTVEGDDASLVEWRSHRIQRRCRSTLAAETMSMDAGFDAAIFVRELLAEALLESYKPTQSGRLPEWFLTPHVVTDCRSLYDLVTKDGPLGATQEKRLTLDIGAIRESAEELDRDCENLKETFRWADSASQLADHLTKKKPSWQLRDALGLNRLSLKKLEPAEPKSNP